MGELQDPSTGFRMPLDVPGALLCTVSPRPSTDPTCKELELGRLDEALGRGAGGFGAATLVHEGRLVHIRATSGAGRLETAENIRAYVTGVEAALAPLGKTRVYGSEPSARYDLVRIHGLDAARFFVDVEVAGPPPVRLRFVEHAFPSGGRTVGLSFYAAGDDASDLPLANGLLGGITLPQPKVLGFGEPHSVQLPRRIGAAIGSFIVPLVIAGIVLAIILWRRRRNAAPGGKRSA